MRHWKTKLTALCAAAAMLLPMTGCSLTASAEELFTLPEFPVEYTGLSNQLNALLGQGYEYVSPSSGRNIQSVQMTDLNGDGYEEAVAFFRAPSGEKPLKIVIFRPTEDSFEQLCTIESSGSAINRVSYQDLNGDGAMELVVGWRISADVQTVAVYEIAPDPVVLMQNSYQSAILQDLDGDGVMDLLVIHAGTKGNGVMDFYHWQVGEQKPVASDCALSSTMAELSAGSFIAGELSDGTPAAFITGVSSSQQAVTDAVIWSGDKLVNVSLPRGGSVSRIAADYQQWKPQDINSDGITELPSPQTPAQERTSGDDIIRWAQVSKSGSLTTVDCTYHSLTGGWYFRLPQSWWSRTSYAEGAGSSNESQLTLLVDGTPVCTIYALTGENRENRALRGNRIILRRQTGVIYAAELLGGAADAVISIADATCPQIGIIMLTARSQEMDKVTGLMTGADDYVTKPFSPAELTARVDALMRRSGGASEESSGEISQPPFLLNTRNRTLEKNGQRIKLTQVEYSIMRMFMENPGKALSREEILDMVWGRNYFGELKIVDVNIRRLRLKIEDNATNPVYITTVWGYGYKWGF